MRKLIERLLRPNPKRVAKLAERISWIDPDRITVDTVMLLFPWTPRWCAKQVLATGLRRGEFILNEDGSARLAPREGAV